MNWLARLRARFVPPSPDDTPPAAARVMDWPAFEDGLLVLLEQELDEFASQHHHETFYALALDCNAHHRDILLCANTPEALASRGQEYAEDESPEAVARSIEALRFNCGDWKYAGVNIDSPAWGERYYEELMADVDAFDLPEDIEHFMESVCRVLLRLQAGEAIQGLRRTADFRVICADAEESIAEGELRLERIRAETLLA